MRILTLLSLSFMVTTLVSCGGDDDGDTPVDANSDPGTFSASVANITTTTATLSWTTPTDPDGDDVSFDIILSGQSLATNLTANSVNITGLTAGTSYSGSVTANDGNGGSNSASFSFDTDSDAEPAPDYVLDPDLFPGAVSIKLVDCILDNGSSTKCYELTFKSNPINDDGPFCPADTLSIGGMGIYDGDNNPGFQVMKKRLFKSMERDGYDIIADDGSIRISDFTTSNQPGLSYCLEPAVDDNLTLVFTIPADPEMANTVNTIESVEWIGVSLDGVPMNGTPPSVVSNNGNIPSLDPCGGHHDPSGYYHWHFVPESTNEVLDAYNITEISCTNITQDNTALSGYAKDGYPIYASADANGTMPSDLDDCNGHTSATDEYPDGIYHYHASSTEAPNVPPCLMGATASERFEVK